MNQLNHDGPVRLQDVLHFEEGTDIHNCPSKGRGKARDGERAYAGAKMLGLTPPCMPEEIEESVLVTLLIRLEPDDDTLPEIERQREWIYEHLKAGDFHYLNPYRIYSACKALHDAGKAVSYMGLEAFFAEQGYSLEVRDDLMTSIERGANNVYGGVEALYGQDYARKIINCAAARDVLHENTEGARVFSGTGSVGVAASIRGQIERLQDALSRLETDSVSGALSDGGAASDVYAYLERQAVRPDDVIPTGVRGLDRLLDGGVRQGEYVTIGGRPGTGKSSLAFGIAWRMAMAGRRVLYVSLEMSRQQLYRRLLAMASGVGLSRLRNPSVLTDAEWKRLYGASPLVSVPLHIEDEPGLTPARLDAKVQELKRGKGLDAVFIDYLQLLRPDVKAFSRENEVASMSAAMKGMAMRHGLPVFVLTQLNRNAEGRLDGSPQLSDIRESDALANDSDAVLFLARDMQAAFAAARRGVSDSITTAVLTKNRSGSVGSIRLLYRGATTSYVDLGLCMNAGAPEQPAWA